MSIASTYNEHSKSRSYLGLYTVMVSFSQRNSTDHSISTSLTGMFLNMASIYMWGAAVLL